MLNTANSDFNGRRVLVAGGTGTIGIPLVRELKKRGAYVTVASLEDEAAARRKIPTDVNYLRADFTQKSHCQLAVDGHDYVFNLVGIKGSVGIGERRVASYLIPMLEFQTNLMQASFEKQVKKFLFVGSVCSYPQGSLHREEQVWQGMPKQNDRIPGIAKRVGELLGEAYALEYGWDAVRVVRPANVYGPHDDFDPRTAQVIPALISRALKEPDRLQVWGDGSAVRDFVYSEDVAYWMCEAMNHAPPNYPINLGSGTGLTIREVAQKIQELTGVRELVFDVTKPAGDPIRLLCIDRAMQVMNYTNITTIEEGLARTIEWYRAIEGKQ